MCEVQLTKGVVMEKGKYKKGVSLMEQINFGGKFRKKKPKAKKVEPKTEKSSYSGEGSKSFAEKFYGK